MQEKNNEEDYVADNFDNIFDIRMYICCNERKR